MRCPDCNKFASLETMEPEVLELDVETGNKPNEAHVFGQVRIARACADCGTELKEAVFDLDETVVMGAVPEDARSPSYSVSEEGIDSTESGGGRYKKNLIGFHLDAIVACKYDEGAREVSQEAAVAASMPASSFDEIA